MTTVGTALVIGAGPGGLAAAAMLGKRGIPTTVLERSTAIAPSWRDHQDQLRLRTTRHLSSLPGLPIPRSSGRWVARDGLVHYLERYAEYHHLRVRAGIDVERIDQGPAWNVRTAGGETLSAAVVVVATGYNHTPYLPSWHGAAEYTGQILHARSYRNPIPFAGRDVLVVGAGNTGTEIALDLANGGAARVRLAVRTPPHIVRSQFAKWAQTMGVLLRHLPPASVDLAARLVVPDLSPYGLPRPEAGLYTRILRDRAVPVQDAGFVDAARAGQIEPVPTVVGFDRDKVLLADGSTITPDAVVAATGYRRGLEQMAGHLGVLDDDGLPRTRGGAAARPGLYFIGFTVSISGALREIGIEARRIARRAAGDRSRSGFVRRSARLCDATREG